MGHDDLHERFRSFGWHVIDVKDGNDIDELHAAFEEAKCVKEKPTVLIANTVKEKVLLSWKIRRTGIIKFRQQKSMRQL